MQTRNDGTHVILPAAAPIARRPDRAGLPVTMLRHSDGKVRHDGSSAAPLQRKHAVAERGRLHGASPESGILAKRIESYIIIREEERRWPKSIPKHMRAMFGDRHPRTDTVTLVGQPTVQQVQDNLTEVMQALLSPLYERFDFFEAPFELFDTELNKLRRGRF